LFFFLEQTSQFKGNTKERIATSTEVLEGSTFVAIAIQLATRNCTKKK
jgi:hypothetical protein